MKWDRPAYSILANVIFFWYAVKSVQQKSLGLEATKSYNFDRIQKRNALSKKEQPKNTEKTVKIQTGQMYMAFGLLTTSFYIEGDFNYEVSKKTSVTVIVYLKSRLKHCTTTTESPNRKNMSLYIMLIILTGQKCGNKRDVRTARHPIFRFKVLRSG